MRLIGKAGIAALSTVPLIAGAIGVSQARKPADFATDVLPVFRARCVSCHGAQSPSAGLDLSTAEGARKGGSGGPLIVPGKPADSLLIKMLRGQMKGRPQMPMGFAPLTEENLQRIESWIAAGGKFEGQAARHWAYVAPVRPKVPANKSSHWVRNPIDAFVLARLEKEGLKPSPEASKEELLRRVSLDLTGLPPTLEEIDAFLVDKRPDAYEKVVDRLLASPHYGERQARIWMDLARYADTNGFEADLSRVMWKWRDWVIEAYNRNMPFDQFTIEQLAGDLLPNATQDQLIATGFHRNTMFNSEGGVDKNEAYFEVLLDRVSTTGTVWLGQTLGCARCHDHKYDPFSQKDFYRLYAFWNNLEAKSEGDHNVGQDKLYEPQIDAATAADREALEKLKAQLDTAEKAVAAASEAAKSATLSWLKEAKELEWQPFEGAKLTATSGVPIKPLGDGSFLPEGQAPEHDTYTFEGSLPAGKWTGFRLEALPDPSLPKKGPGRAESGNFILSRIEASANGKSLEWREFDASFIQEGYSVTGFTDQDSDSGWATWPEAGKRHVLIGAFKEPVAGPARLTFKFIMNSRSWPEHILGRVRLTALDRPDPVRFAYADDVERALADAKPESALPAPIAAFAAKMDPAVRQARAERDALKREYDAQKARIPTALILREKPSEGKPLTAPIHIRGEFLSVGEEVEAGTPSVLNPLPKGGRVDRLALAKWLVSAENPLTARVQVNRMWESVFGRGIVETSDNFGTQGSPPTHPELLDWLATEFVRLKWDQKALLRLIVTSATYRQSSAATLALLQRDPHNELLARGPRFRLTAEAIRDNMLAVSGLLNPKVGGPSVFPYQPEGIWNSPYNGERWMTSKDGDQYRRGIYTYWKRTSPYPAFMAFDAPSREVCTARRERTNTPLQSLTLMNDPAAVEAAKALAKRMLAQKGGTDAKRLEVGFRLCTARRPTLAESARLVALVEKARERYAADPAAAKEFAGSIELAVYALAANTLLNLDETITKG